MDTMSFAEFDAAQVAAGKDMYFGQIIKDEADRNMPVEWTYERIYRDAVLGLVDSNLQPGDLRVAIRPFFRELQSDMAALCTYLGAMGYKIETSGNEAHSPESKTAYIRYDIHIRDLVGAFGFEDYHAATGTPGNMFIQWRDGLSDHSTEPYFCKFGDMAAASMDIGLHISPVDTCLLDTRFAGDTIAYFDWYKTDDAMDWLKSLHENPNKLNEFNAEVEEHACELAKSFYSVFPLSKREIASHGGAVSQCLRAKARELGPMGQMIASFYAENWLTSERIVKLGGTWDVEQCGKHGVRKVSDGGGQIKRMMTSLTTSVEREAPIQILIHPASWFGKRRDGALKELLDLI